jgi:thioredoxin 1
MIRLRILLLVFTSILAASCSSQASDLDNMLAAAQKEGKSVMLELGSVGCIPCEQMKPVMQKLRETYKGKLDVIFIDVRQDNNTARRFGIHIIPVQVFLDKTGKEFHRHVGFYAYDEITPVLKKAGL